MWREGGGGRGEGGREGGRGGEELQCNTTIIKLLVRKLGYGSYTRQGTCDVLRTELSSGNLF